MLFCRCFDFEDVVGVDIGNGLNSSRLPVFTIGCPWYGVFDGLLFVWLVY